MADASANPALATIIAAAAAALSDAQNIRATLIGLETARPAFLANNTPAQVVAFDQTIATTKVAVDQANGRLKAAQEAETAALYAEDQQQKSLIFSAAMLTNTVFWAKFDDAYSQAATRLMAVLEAADVMCRQIAVINADNKPDNMEGLGHAGAVLSLIRNRLVIPDVSGQGYWYNYRNRIVPYADGTSPVEDFLQEVNTMAASLVSAAT